MSNYSCTMPERRAKDRKHYLLLVSAILAGATALFLLCANTTAGVSPVLFWAALVGACFTGAAASLTFWVWWDVR